MMGTCSGCGATDVEVNEAGHCAACAASAGAESVTPEATPSADLGGDMGDSSEAESDTATV